MNGFLEGWLANGGEPVDNSHIDRKIGSIMGEDRTSTTARHTIHGWVRPGNSWESATAKELPGCLPTLTRQRRGKVGLVEERHEAAATGTW